MNEGLNDFTDFQDIRDFPKTEKTIDGFSYISSFPINEGILIPKLPSLKIWLSADQYAKTNLSPSVEFWKNKIFSDINFSHSVLSQMPTLISSANTKVLRFLRTSSQRLTADKIFMKNLDSFSVFVVAKFINTSTANTRFLSEEGAGVGDRIYNWKATDSSGNNAIQILMDTTTGNDKTITCSVADSNYDKMNVYGHFFQRKYNGYMTVERNKKIIGELKNCGKLLNKNSPFFRIGITGQLAPQLPSTFDLSELIIYTTELTPNEKTLVYNYLKNKYSL